MSWDVVASLGVDQTRTDGLDSPGAVLEFGVLAWGASGAGRAQPQTQTAKSAVGGSDLVASASVKDRQDFERGGVNA